MPADQSAEHLRNEATRVIEVNNILSQSKTSLGWQEWDDLFDKARQVYPKKGGFVGTGFGANPPTIEEWIGKIAGGDSPYPNAGDMGAMGAIETQAPGRPDASFYRRWLRLVEYANSVLAARAAAPSSDGHASGSVVPVAAQQAKFEQPPVYLEQPAPPAQSSGVAPKPVPVSVPELPLSDATDYREDFDVLFHAKETLAANVQAMSEELAALQQRQLQLVQAEGVLQQRVNTILRRDWADRKEYDEARQQYNNLVNARSQLEARNGALQALVDGDAVKRREERQLVADRLSEQLRRMWPQFNLQAEAAKKPSDHDRSMAMQVYNEIADILEATCALRPLIVQPGAPFDERSMLRSATVAKTGDKGLIGRVARVNAPGIQDLQGNVIRQMEVEVYGAK